MIKPILSAMLLVVLSLSFAGAPALGSDRNVLVNGGFEQASGVLGRPFAWNPVPAFGSLLTWDFDVARTGIGSIRISNPTPNDAAWTQEITLEPNHNYLLSGWIKTEGVAHTTQVVNAGANLCSWERGSARRRSRAPTTGRTSAWCSTRARPAP
jgi:hypothetical protein